MKASAGVRRSATTERFHIQKFIPRETGRTVNAPIVGSEEMRRKVWKEKEDSVFKKRASSRFSGMLAPFFQTFRDEDVNSLNTSRRARKLHTFNVPWAVVTGRYKIKADPTNTDSFTRTQEVAVQPKTMAALRILGPEGRYEQGSNV
uniref:Uncharacterized protein n=1 Tax=Haemonchus contortus TaxID=6289 RepID=A0A7I4YXD9_HAECO